MDEIRKQPALESQQRKRTIFGFKMVQELNIEGQATRRAF
jgi:hypothetical protein